MKKRKMALIQKCGFSPPTILVVADLISILSKMGGSIKFTKEQYRKTRITISCARFQIIDDDLENAYRAFLKNYLITIDNSGFPEPVNRLPGPKILSNVLDILYNKCGCLKFRANGAITISVPSAGYEFAPRSRNLKYVFQKFCKNYPGKN